jgi:predicted nucleic acid-binding protein
VHFLEEDLQTGIGRLFTYINLDEVRYLLTRGNATAEDREEFEASIRQRNIGGCYLTLTPEQYKKLKHGSSRK